MFGPNNKPFMLEGARVVISSAKIADCQVGPTPPEDVLRFIATTQRKLEDLERTIRSVTDETAGYVDGARYTRLAMANFEAGLLFLGDQLNRARLEQEGKLAKGMEWILCPVSSDEKLSQAEVDDCK